jgi:hypothetical protein
MYGPDFVDFIETELARPGSSLTSQGNRDAGTGAVLEALCIP